MRTLQQLKDTAKFFKRGSIVPRKVLACSPRKRQHQVCFGSDSWVLPGENGYVVFFHDVPGGSAIFLHGKGPLHIQGSPYHPSGITNWIGDFKLSAEDQIQKINELLIKPRKKAVCTSEEGK